MVTVAPYFNISCKFYCYILIFLVAEKIEEKIKISPRSHSLSISACNLTLVCDFLCSSYSTGTAPLNQDLNHSTVFSEFGWSAVNSLHSFPVWSCGLGLCSADQDRDVLVIAEQCFQRGKATSEEAGDPQGVGRGSSQDS